MKTKPILIYDGDCRFCRLWIERWKRITADKVEYEPFQTAADRFPQIPREDFATSVQLVNEDGKISNGAKAVFQTLAVVPGKGWMFWAYCNVPLVSPLCEHCYRFVARHRDTFYKLTRFLEKGGG